MYGLDWMLRVIKMKMMGRLEMEGGRRAVDDYHYNAKGYAYLSHLRRQFLSMKDARAIIKS